MTKILTSNKKPGDIEIDENKVEWVIIAINYSGVSRVRRNSLAHRVHAKTSPEIAKTLTHLGEN